MRRDELKDTARYVAGFLTACVESLAAALWLFVASVLATVKCDDRCSGSGWTHDPLAWQWVGQLLVAGLGVALLMASAGNLVAGRWRRAVFPLVATACVAAVWAVIALPAF